MIEADMAVQRTAGEAPPSWDIDIDRWLNPYLPRSQIHRLPRPLSRFLGYRKEPTKDVGSLLVAFWGMVGCFCGLLLVGTILRYPNNINKLHPPVLFASLGATAILEYNTIRSPLAVPRAIIFGHLVSAVVGVGLTKLFLLRGDYESISFITAAFTCGVASAVMTLTKTTYPPGGATALLAAIDPTIIALGWWFIPLIVLGSALMLVVALLINNIQRQFPAYWWTPDPTGRPQSGDLEQGLPSTQIVGPAPLITTLPSERTFVPIVAIGTDSIALPQGIDLTADEQKVIALLQDRLRQQAVLDHPKNISSDDECDSQSDHLSRSRHGLQ